MNFSINRSQYQRSRGQFIRG